MESGRVLVLATPNGVCRLPVSDEGKPGAPEGTLLDVAVESVSRDSDGTLFAGADGGQIFRSKDGGRTFEQIWEGFPNSRGLWAMVSHPVCPGRLYAGLEPVSLWISEDGGARWKELSSLRNHPASEKWRFFEPSKPHIRAISFDASGDFLYVGIEKGGALVSQDQGRSFEDRSEGVDEDFHGILVSPNDPNLIFGMTGGGLFRSRDGGSHWEKLEEGLDRWYFIPLVWVSSSPPLLVAGAGNTSPPNWRKNGADAAVYWSENGGNRWHLSNGPFPLQGMLSAVVQDSREPTRLFAATTDGLLLSSSNGGKDWRVAADRLPRIEEMVLF